MKMQCIAICIAAFASSSPSSDDRNQQNKLTTANATIVMYRSFFFCTRSLCRPGPCVAMIASRYITAKNKKDERTTPKIP